MINEINRYRKLLETLKEATPDDWAGAFNVCSGNLCFYLSNLSESNVKSSNVYGEIKNFLKEHHEEIMERVINKTKSDMDACIVALEQKIEEVKKLTKAL